ncbi:MAG TPA: HDIG domain-containing protein [Bacteroidaceae bacterium]|nr:HDIG domain-containing protein [Bacteroidaceae bacterium]
MSKKRTWSKLLNNKSIILLLLTAVSILLTVYFMPKDHSKSYEYSIGKPWTYSELIAPFSFSIEKSEENYNKEIDSLRAVFMPYFSLDTNIENESLKKLSKKFDNIEDDRITDQIIQSLRERLISVYKRGVINPEDEERVKKLQYIRTYKGTSASHVSTEMVLTLIEAYQFLMDIQVNDSIKHLFKQNNLDDLILPNLIYDKEKSESDLKSLESQISHFKGMVVANQKIIDYGDIVDKNRYQILTSYEKISSKRVDSKKFKTLALGGQMLFVSVIFLILFFYIKIYWLENVNKTRDLLFLYSCVTFFLITTSLFSIHIQWNIFILPCAMSAIMMKVFLDFRTALIGYLTQILICSVILATPYDFVLLQIVAGLAGIYSLKDLSQRSQIFKTVFVIVLTYCVLYLAMQMIQLDNMSLINGKMFIYFAINGVLLLLTYPLILIIEKLFGFTSNVTLIELSNINHPLLRILSETAPGTFQHSMQVSNLAAEAANEIRANTQLTRTAALYHDIGKMKNPAFFTENQNGNNPHSNLSLEQSAQIVLEHVKEGVKLADKHGLPKVIKDFIITHHGNGTAKYFYISSQNANPDKTIDKSKFSYSGPNPTTKETAIVMMADSIEAASRCLNNYTEENINNLVEQIVNTQVAEGFFKDTPLTFKDINDIKRVFKKRLRTMHHTRISYPTYSKKEGNQIGSASK